MVTKNNVVIIFNYKKIHIYDYSSFDSGNVIISLTGMSISRCQVYSNSLLFAANLNSQLFKLLT